MHLFKQIFKIYDNKKTNLAVYLMYLKGTINILTNRMV